MSQAAVFSALGTQRRSVGDLCCHIHAQHFYVLEATAEPRRNQHQTMVVVGVVAVVHLNACARARIAMHLVSFAASVCLDTSKHTANTASHRHLYKVLMHVN